MSNMANDIKVAWCEEVSSKTVFWQQNPHHILGCFGEYYGYPLSVTKECGKACFAERDTITNAALLDNISFHLLGRREDGSR
jgi:hypothetical protein